MANSQQKQSNKIIGTIVTLAESDNTFSFISYVKGTLAYWKEFLYNVLGMLKVFGITTYFLTLYCAGKDGKNFHISHINKQIKGR